MRLENLSAWAGVALLLLFSGPAASADGGSVGKLQSKDATLFARDVKLPQVLDSLHWKIFKQNDDVPAEQLLMGLPGAVIRCSDGKMDLMFGSDINDKSPYPILEAAIIPHRDPTVDLSFTLDRGRVVLFNARKEGPATAKVKFRDEVWQITIDKPHGRVGIETFGRWPAGTRFKPNPQSKDGPVQQTIVLVLKGTATLKTKAHRIALDAPPGPAIYHWDNVHGEDRTAKFLKEIPDWAHVDFASEAVRKKMARIEKVRRTILREKDTTKAVHALLTDKDVEIRRKAPIAAGAFDALPELAAMLQHSTDVEVWQTSVAVLRHWLGRAPGQDQLLFALMTNPKNPKAMPKAHAQTIIQLLHGFNEEDQGRPELYDVLIHLLTHERLGIRGLAAWHLHHLAPTAKIPFNPGGDKEEQEKTAKAWREHVPHGKLPPKESSKESE